MKWFCFMFWFCYRLFMACLQHFNWCVAMYTNCVYFSLWKSYDLFWFWMHIMLCSCFPPLRRENYLLVWCNLIKKRYTTYPNHTYKQIYLILYGGHGTKAEQALENIEKKEESERQDRSSRRMKRRMTMEKKEKGQTIPPGEVEEMSSSEDDEEETVLTKNNSNTYLKPRIPDVIKEEEEECRKYVYVGEAVEDSEKDLESMVTPVPPPRRSRSPITSTTNGVVPQFSLLETNEEDQLPTIDEHQPLPSNGNRPDDLPPGNSNDDSPTEKPEDGVASGEESDTNSTSRWIDKVPAIPKAIRNRFRRGDSTQTSPKTSPTKVRTPEDDNVSVTSTWSKVKGMLSNVSMPSMPKFNRSASNDQSVPPPVDILRPDFKNTYDLLDPKKRAHREKRDRKALTKRVRKRIKDELRELARKERQRRMITDAIELILQLLRMMTSFATLVGNIRKTFIPAQFKYLRPGQHHYDYPLLLMVFRVTTFLDVTMFSINFLWAYCLQWHLCCRLGIVRFWFWTFVLLTIASVTMFTPMSYAMDQMDLTWCHFKNDSPLLPYQPKWHW